MDGAVTVTDGTLAIDDESALLPGDGPPRLRSSVRRSGQSDTTRAGCLGYRSEPWCSRRVDSRLYIARGRGETGDSRFPHQRARMIYDTAARSSAREQARGGRIHMEIARSEIAYTGSGRPIRCRDLAAALREGFRGPVFIQGDHFQVSREVRYRPVGELNAVSSLHERLRCRVLQHRHRHVDSFDLSKSGLDQQQKNQYSQPRTLQFLSATSSPKE